MSLTNEELEAIVSFRIKKATETLEEAKGITESGYWTAAANRLYYACYYITSALLIKYKYAAQTHREVFHLLGLHFLKEGIVSPDSGKFYSKLYEIRQSDEYDDLFKLTESEVKPLITAAEKYMDELINLIHK